MCSFCERRFETKDFVNIHKTKYHHRFSSKTVLSKEWFSDKDETTKDDYSLDSPQNSKESEIINKEEMGTAEAGNCVNIWSPKSN